MAIKSLSEKPNKQIEIDLTSPEGNAFNLIGLARRLAVQIGKNAEEITKDMMSGDYEHLISVFDHHFGSIVTLYK